MSKLKLIIGFLVIVLVAVGVYFLLVQKTEEEKMYRVGVLWTGGEFFSDLFAAFKEEMTELGYIEDQNIAYDIYKAPEPVGNEEIVRRYVDDEVDLIFSFATEATIEAKEVAMGTGIPVVFTCAFIEGTYLVDSVSSPGGNITGVRYPTTESAVGRLEYLHDIAPQVKRIWVPCLKDYPTVAAQFEAMEPVASSLEITLIPGPFASPAEVKVYLDERAASADIGMDAIIMLAEPFSITPEVTELVFEFADENNLPVSSAMVLEETYGPIVGFHPTNTKMGSLAAPQVDKVLKGIAAGTIPVVTADNDLRINYKAAQELGLDVPEGLLERAIEIIR
jgi:putative ABC transport system substrate-binding protein